MEHKQNPPKRKQIRLPSRFSVHPYTTVRRMSHEQWLAYLQQLLVNLPESTPYRSTQSTDYNFSVSGEEVEEYGDKTSATNHRLEINFGPRHHTDGIVPITERGPGICAVVSALSKCSSTDARVELWVKNLCSSAEKLYTVAGKEVKRHLLRK